METEDLIFDHCGKRQEIEQVCEVLPHVGIGILADALIVEPVDLGDLARLVVAAQDGDAIAVADFEADQQGHGFDGVVAAIDVVSHE
jgi:hypothetical protein